jgi:hypothetical protein
MTEAAVTEEELARAREQHVVVTMTGSRKTRPSTPARSARPNGRGSRHSYRRSQRPTNCSKILKRHSGDWRRWPTASGKGSYERTG